MAVEISNIEQLQQALNDAKGGNSQPATKVRDDVTGGKLVDFDKNRELANCQQEIQKITSTFDKPPRYFKPSFLLKNLSPKIKATILMKDYNDPTVWIKHDLFMKQNSASIQDPDPLPVHNYIKSFSFEMTKSQAKIELVDVDSSLIEAFILRYQRLTTAVAGMEGSEGSVIHVDVEYGWNVPKEYIQEWVGRNKIAPIFSRTMTFALTNPEVKYNLDGTISCTLNLNADPNKFPPFNWWIPFNTFFHPYPLLPLVFDYVFATLVAHLNQRTLSGIKSFGEWFFNNIVGANVNLDDFNNLMASIVGVTTDLVDAGSARIGKFSQGDLDRMMGTKLNKTQKITWDAQKPDTSSINMGDILFSLLENKVQSGEKELDRVPDGASIKDHMPLTVRLSEQLGNTLLGNALKNAKKLDANSSNIYTTLSIHCEHLKKQAIVDPKKKQEYIKLNSFLSKIQIFLLDFYIHPYVAELYIMTRFKNDLKEKRNVNTYADQSLNELEIVNIRMVDDKIIEPKGIIENFIKTRKIMPMTRIQRESWAKTVKDYVAGPGTSWADLLSTVVGFEKFIDPMIEQGDKLVANKENVPSDMILTSFVATKTAALDNLNLIKNLEQMKKTGLAMTAPSPQSDENGRGVNKDGQATSITEMIEFVTSQPTNTKFLFFIKDFMANGGFFNPNYGKSQILQAFCFRGYQYFNNSTSQQFNPGFPSAWDVSFPDVMSFDPEFDFYSSAQAVTYNLRPLNVLTGQIQVADEEMQLLQDSLEQGQNLVDKLEELNKTIDRNQGNVAAKKTAREKAEAEKATTITELESVIQNYNSKKLNINKIRNNPYPVNLNLDFNYSVTNNGDLPEVLAAKRQTQTFRNRLMSEVLNIKAKMTVIGDPSFNFDDGGAYIFLKVINSDGALSIFTGLYIIEEINHSIESGKFITEFSIRQDNSISPDNRAYMMEGIYKTDKMHEKNR